MERKETEALVLHLVVVVQGIEEPGVVHGLLPLVRQDCAKRTIRSNPVQPSRGGRSERVRLTGIGLLDPLEPPLGLAGGAGVARPPVRVPLLRAHGKRSERVSRSARGSRKQRAPNQTPARMHARGGELTIASLR